MSVVNLDLDMTVANIVEAMLPRFSDHQLGLLVSFDFDFSDYGYGKDGNTQEREPLHIRRNPHMLFVRPSNYTKVYFFEGEAHRSPLCKETIQWEQTSDHDSCWRSDGFRKLTEIYFECCEAFKDREISGEKMRPCDIHQFNRLDRDPKYVRLLTHEQSNKDAKLYSQESWIHDIAMEGIGLDELEVIGYMEKNHQGRMQKFMSGMLVKGSEDHGRFVKRRDRA